MKKSLILFSVFIISLVFSCSREFPIRLYEEDLDSHDDLTIQIYEFTDLENYTGQKFAVVVPKNMSVHTGVLYFYSFTQPTVSVLNSSAILNAYKNYLSGSDGTAFITVFPPVKGTDPMNAEVFHSYIYPFIKEKLGFGNGKPAAIGGQSWGGGMALQVFLHDRDRFQAVGLHSPYILDGDLEKLKAVSDPFYNKYLWLDCGVSDPILGNIQDISANRGKGLVYFDYHEWPGKHDGAYFTAHLDEYLKFYSNSLSGSP